MAPYRPRSVDRILRTLLGELPAVQLVGPRATGKTTTALQHAESVVRLDQAGEAAVFAADPDAALRARKEPVLLDEWQALPSVMGAVKRAVDDDFRPGRFLLTGSADANFAADAWPGTGRIVRTAMFGLTMAERMGRPEAKTLIDRLVDADSLLVPPDPPDLRGYVQLALESGFPQALRLSESARQAWLEGYVDQLVQRDVPDVEDRVDVARLRRYFEAFALNTAGNVSDATLIEAAGINRRTAESYERLLARLFVVDSLPAWSTNRLRRLVRSPKRYLVDPALAVGLLRIDADAVMRDGDLLGRILDSFVVAQLRSEATWSASRARLYHLREHDGRHEIDLVAEVGPRGVVAVEVKATSAPAASDARHLEWLRDQLGPDFLAGVVLHTGARPFELGDRITAAPIATLWA